MPDAPGGADAGVRAVTVFQQRKKHLLYRLVTCRAAILARIGEVLASHGVKSTREDLGSLIFDHVLRCALFPTLMSVEIQKQMRGIRMEHPFEFDFGADLSECLRAFDERLFVEPDFLSLYVLASLEHFTRSPVSLLLVCGRPSVATINKSLIERGTDGVEIELVDGERCPACAPKDGSFDLVMGDATVARNLRPHVNGTSRFRACSRPTRSTASARWRCVCSTSATSRACCRARAILSCMLGPATTSTSCRARSTGWWKRAISADETALIIDRERQGDRLQLGQVAFPHTITPVAASTFRLLAIMPDVPLCDGDEQIDLVVVTLASQRLADKSSMFNYLFSVLHDAERAHVRLPRTYEEIVAFLGRDFGYSARRRARVTRGADVFEGADRGLREQGLAELSG